MGKGNIVRYEQFLLFPQCFQKGRQKGSLCGNGLIPLHFQTEIDKNNLKANIVIKTLYFRIYLP